jgi:hypothetical protein
MAKIIAEFDTQTKELSVRMNDKKMVNIDSVVFMSDYEDKKKGYVEISSHAMDEDEKVMKVERIYASQEDFEVVRDSGVQKEMAELMAARRSR